jgi:hypothetical protein
MREPIKTEWRRLYDRLIDWPKGRQGWDMAAIDAIRDAILRVENGNIGCAWAYVREADGYLAAAREGRPSP